MTFYLRIIKNAYQDLCLVNIFFIMYPQIIRGVPFIKIYHTGSKTIQLYSLVICSAECERLTLLQEQCFLRLASFFCIYLKGPIIKDVAVLVDLQERSSFMLVGPDQHRLHMLWITVHCSRYKSCVSTKCKCRRIKRMVNTSKRSRLRDFVYF